ncbi:serine hydrolase domain-containing protein [Roseivirga sp. 4D4]|uniref:serine hydrolase domain-containing protein n=1 Tax=Roseivirga sp. 4D4 TaxID=1889784 RepID=UPI000B13E9E4|nr:serine hydrolase domain-containing protein [Roseivirga sp. 4D4]
MRTLTTLLCLSLTFSAHAQEIERLIEKQGRSLRKNKEFRALSIGIYKDGQTYTDHFGTLDGSSKPTNETIYEIASVSKTFTGYLVAKAVIEGKINLEDNIDDLIDGDFSNLSFEGKPIKVKHLLAHTAGLPHFMAPGMAEAFEKPDAEVPIAFQALEQEMSKERFLELLKAFKPQTAPGTNYKYSNAGAELLAYILTSVYDKPFDAILKDQIFSPLNMNDSGIRLTAEQKGRLAQGYWSKNKTPSPSQIIPLWGGGNGVNSTLPDLMKWVEFNLNSQEEALKESQRIIYEKKTRWMAYLWNGWKDKNGTSYNHHGGTTGTQNWIFLFPKYNLGFSIIVNQSDEKTPRQLSSAISKMLKEITKSR